MQSVDEVIQYDRQLINDERVTVEALGYPIEPHPISAYDDNAFGFQAIKKSVRQVFNNAVVIPGIMLASTDTRYAHHQILDEIEMILSYFRWYLNLTRAVYRFAPSVLYAEDTVRYAF